MALSSVKLSTTWLNVYDSTLQWKTVDRGDTGPFISLCGQRRRRPSSRQSSLKADRWGVPRDGRPNHPQKPTPSHPESCSLDVGLVLDSWQPKPPTRPPPRHSDNILKCCGSAITSALHKPYIQTWGYCEFTYENTSQIKCRTCFYKRLHIPNYNINTTIILRIWNY